MLHILLSFSLFSLAVDSIVLYGPGSTVVSGDLDISGKIYNADLWRRISNLFDESDCRIDNCNGHGTCIYQFPNCTCDEGWCGPSCTISDANPVRYHSTTSISSSVVQVVFNGTNCTNLTKDDEIRFVKGNCSDPLMFLQSATNATIAANGQAKFTVDISTLSQPFTMCYRVSGSGNYRSLANTPTTFSCSGGAYVCPSIPGGCVSSCFNCPGYNYAWDPNKICLTNIAPMGNAYCTCGSLSGYNCGSCRVGQSAAQAFDGNYYSTVGGESTGSCAVWDSFDTSYLIYQLKYYSIPGFENRAMRASLLLFNESVVPPLTSDNEATVFSKAYYQLYAGDTYVWSYYNWTFNLNPPVSARHVGVSRPSWAVSIMNFGDLEIYAAPLGKLS